MRGARGNVGKQFVYRKHGDNTTIARMPSINKDAVPSAKQTENRELFADAASYAQGAMSSADLKKEYEKKATPGKTAFNIAFRDYLKAPVVKKIDVSNYKGTVGSVIVINANFVNCVGSNPGPNPATKSFAPRDSTDDNANKTKCPGRASH